MKTSLVVCCLLLASMVLLTTYSGCAPADGGGGGDGGGIDGGGGGGIDGGGGGGGVDDGDGGGSGDDTIVSALIKTGIAFENSAYRASGKLAVGEDLIVWGLPDDGVFYLVPSTADMNTAAGTKIANSELLFGFRDFAVAGKKVVLVRSTNEVAVFNTVTGGEAVDIPGGDITLHALPTEANAPGHMMADGCLVATINDASTVTDGNAVKVIDLSGATPTVISCAQPTAFLATFEQVAVDAETRQVVAYARNPGESIYLWDLDNPSAQPAQFDLSGDNAVKTTVQIQLDGNYVLYRQGFTDATALLNLTNGNVTAFTKKSEYAVNTPVALNGGKFGFFVAQESADSIFGGTAIHRSAIGAVGDAPAATLASQTTAIPAASACVQQTVPYGYDGLMAITPDGTRWFLSGTGFIDFDLEYFQMNDGTGWTLFADVETLSGWLMATDVACSADTVAFRALRQQVTSGCLTNDTWVLGFIVLNRLD
ncbi:MAG: hypothetical protein JXA69_16880 [Phycisphaerae bacterium]|nr:hypothetical protein [Phycisphaerae bacterium]